MGGAIPHAALLKANPLQLDRGHKQKTPDETLVVACCRLPAAATAFPMVANPKADDLCLLLSVRVL